MFGTRQDTMIGTLTDGIFSLSNTKINVFPKKEQTKQGTTTTKFRYQEYNIQVSFVIHELYSLTAILGTECSQCPLDKSACIRNACQE